MTQFHHTRDTIPDDPATPIPYPDDYLREVLGDVHKVAVVGFKPGGESHDRAEALKSMGYRVIPVNPDIAGEIHVGEVVPARLADIPSRIDMVIVFGTPKDAEIAAEGACLAKDPFGLKVLWLGKGARNPDAARKAEEAGLRVVMDRDAAEEAARLKIH